MAYVCDVDSRVTNAVGVGLPVGLGAVVDDLEVGDLSVASDRLLVTPTLAHFAVEKRSDAMVSAMLPPSARNMPYFCSARATTRAPRSAARDRKLGAQAEAHAVGRRVAGRRRSRRSSASPGGT